MLMGRDLGTSRNTLRMYIMDHATPPPLSPVVRNRNRIIKKLLLFSETTFIISQIDDIDIRILLHLVNYLSIS